MWKIRDIYRFLDSISPFASMESWDNCSLNVGDIESSVEHITLCLEINNQIASELAPNTLVISHHPLIFSPLRQIDTRRYPSNIIASLLAKNCHLLALHTNFDKSHLNEYFTKKALKYTNATRLQDGISFGVEIDTSFHALLSDTSKKLNLVNLRYVQASQNIKHILIVCGSGISLLKELEILPHTCIITGDIKHHDAGECLSNGISIIEVEHYESEKFFSSILGEILQNNGYKCIITDCKNPFSKSQGEYQ